MPLPKKLTGRRTTYPYRVVGAIALLVPLYLNISALIGIGSGDILSAVPDLILPTRATKTHQSFCEALPVSSGPQGRKFVHAFVSNTGHFPFLHNVLLSMANASLSWRPVVFAMGIRVCHLLRDLAEPKLKDYAVCHPYLGRLLHQLRRDEPESFEQIQPFLAKSNTTSVNKTIEETIARFDEIDSTFYGWGSTEHKFLINSKLYALRDILECGFDAFITDTDIGFISNPLPYFDIDGPKGHVIAQTAPASGYSMNINSGFMYWRSTNDTIDLIWDIITVPPFWHIDQSRVNAMIKNRSTPYSLLDSYKFPQGNRIMGRYEKGVDTLADTVVAHANWNDKFGEKEALLRKMGLWFLD